MWETITESNKKCQNQVGTWVIFGERLFSLVLFDQRQIWFLFIHLISSPQWYLAHIMGETFSEPSHLTGISIFHGNRMLILILRAIGTEYYSFIDILVKDFVEWIVLTLLYFFSDLLNAAKALKMALIHQLIWYFVAYASSAERRKVGLSPITISHSNLPMTSPGNMWTQKCLNTTALSPLDLNQDTAKRITVLLVKNEI